MLGDLMGNMEEKQALLQAKLATIIIEAEAGDGAVKVLANANKEITNISIDKEKVSLTDIEELEDLILVAVNRAIGKAAEREAKETQSLLSDLLPPGMANLGDMF